MVYVTVSCKLQQVIIVRNRIHLEHTPKHTHTHSLVLNPTPFVLSFHSVIPSERVIPVIHKPSSEQTIIVTDHRNGSVSSKGKG